MNIRQALFGVVSTLIWAPVLTASEIDQVAFSQGIHPVFSLQAGYASINTKSNAQYFVATDDDVMSYNDSGREKNTGFIGIFLGAEHGLPWVSRSKVFAQTGVEYNYFGKVGINGTNTVGIDPLSSTTYHYHYSFQTQQVLGTFKLFTSINQRFHPYTEVGAGAAFNRALQYNATTTETGSVNLTPGFGNQKQTEFSYMWGLGVDTQMDNDIRVGLGYRYTNVGSSFLNNGIVSINNYQSPIPFKLGSSDVYVHQVIARISY